MPLPPLVRQLVDKKLTKYCEQKIPPNLRDQIKIHYKVRGNSVTVFESRPYWLNPSEWSQMKIAQFRFDPKRNAWTLYCVDRNERWQIYFDLEPSSKLDDLLREVDEDPTGIFWG